MVSLESIRGGGRPKAPIDSGAKAKIVGDEFTRFVMVEDHPILADAQPPESGELVGQDANVALFPDIHIIQCPTNISSYARMQLLESGNDLVGESHAEISFAS